MGTCSLASDVTRERVGESARVKTTAKLDRNNGLSSATGDGDHRGHWSGTRGPNRIPGIRELRSEFRAHLQIGPVT